METQTPYLTNTRWCRNCFGPVTLDTSISDGRLITCHHCGQHAKWRNYDQSITSTIINLATAIVHEANGNPETLQMVAIAFKAINKKLNF